MTTPSTFSSRSNPDFWTIIAIAVVAYVVSNVGHEGVGHGGTCLMVGCTPHLLTSMQFDGDVTQVSSAARRFIAAGGSIANLIIGAFALLYWRRARAATGWFFAWLLMTISWLQATGYLLFSGVGNVGDWAVVIEGLPVALAWHIALAIVGGAAYWVVTRWCVCRLGERLHADDARQRVRAAYRFTLTAYFAGGALYVIAGMFDPLSAAILLISGVAASFGGTSGLAWGPQLLRGARLPNVPPPLELHRSWRWIVAGILCAAIYISVLGPGIRF